MKSVIKLKIIGLDYYTMEKVNVKKKITCEGSIFEDRKNPPLVINGGKYTLPESTTTAKELADDWVSTQSDFLMDVINDPKRELNCILDWEILEIQNIQDGVTTLPMKVDVPIKLSTEMQMGLVLKGFEEKIGREFDEDFKAGFLHTYLEMKDKLKGLSLENKISIVLAAMGVGLKAASNAYSRISEILLRDNTDELDEAAKSWPKKQIE
jgi:hypothetical protein